MSTNSWPVLAAALSIALAGQAWAQLPGQESAQQNVRESEQYERLLCTNPGFRAQRIQMECAPIGDPQLHEGCVASFNCGSPPPPLQNAMPPSETIH